jgi:hypothetical protein
MRSKSNAGNWPVEKPVQRPPEREEGGQDPPGYDGTKINGEEAYPGLTPKACCCMRWSTPLLNPYEWIDRTIIGHRPQPSFQPAQSASEGPQTLNDRAFLESGSSIPACGLNWFDAEPLLRQQAQAAAHGTKSVAERLIDLKRYGRKMWRS